MPEVRQEVQLEELMHEAHEVPRSKLQASRVQGVREEAEAQGEFRDPHAHPYGGGALHMLHLRQGVQTRTR